MHENDWTCAAAKTGFRASSWSFRSKTGQRCWSFFDDIEVIPYANSMVFDRDSVDDCVCYIEKKRLLMFKEVFDSHPKR